MTNAIELTQVDTLRIHVKQPFSFRYTVWKPSHFDTGLETHTASKSWRTFRIGPLICGVSMHESSDSLFVADVYTDGRWSHENRLRLQRRLVHSYGLNEDLSDFVAQAEKVPEIREALTNLAGMRPSCPENLFEIAIISLLLQNATVARTTQMMTNLLDHYGSLVSFDGVGLKAFFSPSEIAGVSETVLREQDRLGYRAKYIGRFAEFFVSHDPDAASHLSRDALMEEFQQIKGVGPYTAAVIASHAIRDRSALGLDVWNKKLLAKRFFQTEDASAMDVMARMNEYFPKCAGLAGLYVVENEYRARPVVPLRSSV